MVVGSRGPAFPVVFFDGEKEMNIGTVKINPTLEYKPFQLMLSQMIGISPNQISIYLMDKKKNHNSSFSGERRRFPITGKIKFGLICREKDCCFLVVLKRSRKSRSRSRSYLPADKFSQPLIHPLPENLVLLRRQQPVPFYDQITQSELVNLNNRLQSLRFHRETYQMAMAQLCTDSHMNPNLNTDSFRIIDDLYGDPAVITATPMMMITNETEANFCEECVNVKRNSNTTSFHPCVNDPVITRFRTRVGPINRP